VADVVIVNCAYERLKHRVYGFAPCAVTETRNKRERDLDILIAGVSAGPAAHWTERAPMTTSSVPVSVTRRRELSATMLAFSALGNTDALATSRRCHGPTSGWR
jgi:hypothetical protein